jgi:isopenicillin N synthase-like dioxygenase
MTIEDPSTVQTPVSPSNVAIPVVDFSRWHTGTGQQRLAIARSLTAACKEFGFVQIINHDIVPDLLAQAFQWTESFFALPQADKMKAPHPDGAAVHRGYSHPGLEKVSQAMNERPDSDVAQELRQIQDYKVRRFHFTITISHTRSI